MDAKPQQECDGVLSRRGASSDKYGARSAGTSRTTARLQSKSGSSPLFNPCARDRDTDAPTHRHAQRQTRRFPASDTPTERQRQSQHKADPKTDKGPRVAYVSE
eukprot:1778403-Rhodomonas_salina.1